MQNLAWRSMWCGRWRWVLAVAAVGCGSAKSSSDGAGTGAGGSGGLIIVPGVGGSGASGNNFPTDGALPDGFTPTELGGYKLGDPLVNGAGGSAGTMNTGEGCGSVLTGLVRDFQESHPDFGDYCCGDTRGALAANLGADQKPVYALSGPAFATGTMTRLMTGPAQFDQWYRNVADVNKPYLVYLSFVQNGGVFTFQSDSFFPLDGKGWGNENASHNFSFTTELHTQFKYQGGETFRFTGDDDLWVFINGKLAIDLGGVHAMETQLVNLDDRAGELGIGRGSAYPLDLFHAERHQSQSTFRVDTNLQFTNCGVIIAGDVH